MKKNFTLFILACSLSVFVTAQISYTNLNQNNCNAALTDIGLLFHDIQNSGPGYEIPSGSGTHAVYAANMWFGGKDINGQLKLAAQTFGPPSQDFWPGALATDGTANLPPNLQGQTLWKVSRSQINDHILHYQSPGYSMPADLENWPAHGDFSLSQAYDLAPYVDVDGNNIYEPQNGDYPCIKGDEAVYMIINDKGGAHGSGGDGIGIEQHYMIYQYSSNPDLNDVTFIETKIINRGTATIYDYVSTFFIDGDIGYSQDDYAGSDSTRNLLYFFNSDSNDESMAISGYGAAPPAVGLVCLSDSVHSIGIFSNNATYPYSDPVTADDYYNLMHRKYLDGSPWLDGNGLPTKFQYSGDPNNPGEWTEIGVPNVPGDRRGIISIEKGQLNPFEQYSITYALVYARSSSNLASVTQLYQTVDEVQNFYDNMADECYGSNLGINEQTKGSIIVAPNPSKGVFTIELPIDLDAPTVSLIDMHGRTMLSEKYPTEDNLKFVTNVSPGVYIVEIKSGSIIFTERIIIE